MRKVLALGPSAYILYLMKTTTTQTRFAVIRDSHSGRTWYHAKDGAMTRRVVAMWTTADRDEAIMLAGKVAGHVVSV